LWAWLDRLVFLERAGAENHGGIALGVSEAVGDCLRHRDNVGFDDPGDPHKQVSGSSGRQNISHIPDGRLACEAGREPAENMALEGVGMDDIGLELGYRFA
jgi:hypothetical protein